MPDLVLMRCSRFYFLAVFALAVMMFISGCQWLLGIEEVKGEGGDNGNDSAPGPGNESQVLVGEGLVARYYIDTILTDGSAGSAGMGLGLVRDSAASGLDLTVFAGTSNSAPVLLSDVDQHSGLRWAELYRTGAAATANPAAVDTALKATKLATQITIEMVVDIDGLASAPGSMLSFLGASGQAVLPTLRAYPLDFGSNDDRIVMTWPPQAEVRWSAPLRVSGRVVLHVVVDTSLANAEDRMQLYINGIRRMRTSADNIVFPAMNQAVILPDQGCCTYALGSRWDGQDGSQTIQGVIYYAALYASALAPADIAHNTALLQTSDDPPPL